MTVTSGGRSVVVDVPVRASETPGAVAPTPADDTGRSEAPGATVVYLDRERARRVDPMSEAMRRACALAVYHPSPDYLFLDHRPEEALDLIEMALGRYSDAQLARWQFHVPPQCWPTYWESARDLVITVFQTLVGAYELPTFARADFVALHSACHVYAGGIERDCRCLMTFECPPGCPCSCSRS